MEVTQNGTAIKEDEQKTTDITNGITDINIPNKDQVTENDKLSGEVTQNGTNDSGLVKEEPKKDGNSEGSADAGTLNIVYNLADFVNKIAFGVVIWAAATSGAKAK